MHNCSWRSVNVKGSGFAVNADGKRMSQKTLVDLKWSLKQPSRMRPRKATPIHTQKKPSNAYWVYWWNKVITIVCYCPTDKLLPFQMNINYSNSITGPVTEAWYDEIIKIIWITLQRPLLHFWLSTVIRKPVTGHQWPLRKCQLYGVICEDP